MTGPPGPDERRWYQRGYTAGRRRIERETYDGDQRAASAVYLFECLVEGLVLQGVTLDAVIDAQLAGAMARERQGQAGL